MALAYLLQQLSEGTGQKEFKLMGLIVNHNARKESGEEAKYVRFQLRRLGTW